MPAVFYTYLWLREDGTPYYVGKGRDNRAFIKHGHRASVPPKGSIILQEFSSEEDAFAAEKFLISYYGRKDLSEGRLINLTDGGEGHSNPSEITRHKMRKAKEGVSQTSEHRKNISRAAQLGSTGKASPSLLVRKRISEKLLGTKQTSEHVRNVKFSMTTIRKSESYRNKMRAAANKRWQGEIPCPSER